MLVLARKLWAYGDQYDYFDKRSSIGWTRTGHPLRCGGAGLAVLLNISLTTTVKKMFVGLQHKQELWTDLITNTGVESIIQDDGYGVFEVGSNETAVWVNKSAPGRERLRSVCASFYQQPIAK